MKVTKISRSAKRYATACDKGMVRYRDAADNMAVNMIRMIGGAA